ALLYALHPFAVAPVIAGYVGLVLLGIAFVACGAAASTVSENQVVSAMLTYGILVFAWFATWNEAAIGAAIAPALLQLSLFDHFGITLFYSSQAGALRREMTDLLALYQEAQPRITVRAFDLDRSPGMAKRLGVGSYNTAVVEAGERHEAVEVVSEEGVTAALLAVAGTPPVATYFVVGRGEDDPRDNGGQRGAFQGVRRLTGGGFRPGT